MTTRRLSSGPVWPVVILCAALAVASCAPADQGSSRPADVQPSTWVVPPRFEAADFSGEAVIVSGRVEPNRRVVLTDQDGLAAAASADAHGAFSIRLAPGAELSLWRVEVAAAADEARTGQWIAVAPSARVAVVLRSGAAARPVGGRSLLASADYDGGGLLVAGRAAPRQEVQVSLENGAVQTVRADGQGWYDARFPAIGPGPHRIRARTESQTREAAFDLAVPSGVLDFARVASGPHIDWPTPGGGGQATWLFESERAAVQQSAP